MPPLDLEVFSKLRLPSLKESCCGCSLELGAKIVAFVHVFIYGGLFLTVFIMVCYHDYQRYLRNHYIYDFDHAFVRDEFAMALIFSTVIYSLALSYGILKKDKLLCVPWLFLKVMMLSFNTLNIVESTYLRFSRNYKAIEIFILLAYYALDAYQTTVVYSYYKELKMRDGDYD